jgi:hypothetical protein
MRSPEALSKGLQRALDWESAHLQIYSANIRATTGAAVRGGRFWHGFGDSGRGTFWAPKKI